jgi:hypothetical protein
VFKVYSFMGNFQPIRPGLAFSAKYRKYPFLEVVRAPGHWL